MLVEVRLFGGLVDRAGTARTSVELHEDATVADLRREIAAAHPALAPLLDAVNVAVDLELADGHRRLRGATEIAMLPPVAGGSSSPRRDAVRIVTGLTNPPLEVDATVARIATPDVGGTAVFLGTVRDHAPDLDEVVGLEYSAYPQMAERELAAIADEIAADHPQVRGIALLHSVGELAVGDHTILIVCTAAHRAAAFDACRDALERVKARVPVWKRERTAGGDARWVGLPAPDRPAG